MSKKSPKKEKEPKKQTSAPHSPSTGSKEKPVKEIPVIQDMDTFYHDTGDVYEGGFEAKKKDKSIKMHGPGKYTTNEGDSYEGTWQYNTLASAHDNVTITYQDGSTYIGQFKNWCYNGSGSYIYPDEAELRGDFVDNCPVGNLVLEDPNGRTWLGKAQPGFCWFCPINHYYEDLKYKKALARLTTKASPSITTKASPSIIAKASTSIH